MTRWAKIAASVSTRARPAAGEAQPVVALARRQGIGRTTATRLWLEGRFRRFDNRRQIGAYAGLAPSPWQSGGTNREPGLAKSGNPRLRTTMVELAWFWRRHRPGSAPSAWFRIRVGAARGRVRRVAIVALARKLLVALWRDAVHGLVPEGAALTAERSRSSRRSARWIAPGAPDPGRRWPRL